MVRVEAFRGWRYDLGHVGSLSSVVAPPYDVIDDELRDELYKLHPCNVVRLILNRPEPGDSGDERYHRAARLLKNWRSEGVLQEEADPAIYVYHQTFTTEQGEFTRRGFMARLGVERFGEGSVYPHEETHAAAKADRLRLMDACQANLSQIFGLYPDPGNAVQDRLEQAIAEATPLEATDHLGVRHQLWPVTDVKVIGEIVAGMADKEVFVADGHHRYETACNFHDRARENDPGIDANHPSGFVLSMFVGINDPGMVVLPTHRLFRGLPPITSEALMQRLGACFECRLAGEGPDLAESLWSQIETADDQGRIGLYAAADQRWVAAEVNDSGRQRLKELSPEHSDDWRGLGVSILHRLIIDTLLEAPELPKPKYVHLVSELIEALESDDEGQYNLAALVMPATLDHVRAISEYGERMPPKSTYFYPKLLSGLVINSLQ